MDEWMKGKSKINHDLDVRNRPPLIERENGWIRDTHPHLKCQKAEPDYDEY